MANANLRIVGHFRDANGKTLTHFGTVQYLVTASMLTSSGEVRPDPSAITTVLSAHAKVPAGATFVIDGVANLDHEHSSGLLT